MSFLLHVSNPQPINTTGLCPYCLVKVKQSMNALPYALFGAHSGMYSLRAYY